MNNNDERDYAEEAANRQLLHEGDVDEPRFSTELVHLIREEQDRQRPSAGGAR